MNPIAIGIDLGGTRIKGVAVNARTGEILKQLYEPTAGAANWQQAVQAVYNELRQHVHQPNGTVTAAGLSAPGLPNSTNEYIAYMPGRLPGLERLHWGDRLGQPVSVVNDAHAALLAESRFGVARHHQNVVMLTLGTGVGGGILINGELYQGAGQKAGHLGHLTVNGESDLSITGQPGSLENAIGNATVEKRSQGRFTSTAQLLDAYRQGDALAQWVWLSSVRHLALGICSLTNTFSPELVVLGGGITQAQDDLLLPLARFMELHEWRPGGSATPVRLAQFGDMAGALGAASFALQHSAGLAP